MSGTSSRMLALLSLLQSRRDWPGGVLAERLEVTSRTIRRDVDRLRELGYTISAVRGPEGGYRLAAGTELPPLLFDDEQAVAIAVALQSVPATGVDLDVAAARALLTVRQVMPSRLRHRIDGVRFTVAETAARVDPAVIEIAGAAARQHRTLRFAYPGAEGVEPRRVEPHTVLARGGRWYLVAWDPDRDDWRGFRLDRVTDPVPGGAPFTPRRLPADDAAAFVSARFRGSAEPDAWPCTGEFLLELPAAAIAPWLGDGELEDVSPTTSRIRVRSWSWAGALAWILRFDAPFTVLGPPALAAVASGLAARIGASVAGAESRRA